MTVENLLKPRYKVIADYPDTIFEIGEILLFKTGNFWISPAGNYWYERYLDSYPYIFKKLAWWEEREDVEMPEYVKYELHGVVNVKKVLSRDLDFNTWHPENSIEMRMIRNSWYTPTTKEEFDCQQLAH